MDPDKERFAQETSARKLGEVIDGADVFLGLSAGGVLKPEMVARMAARPLILALANPTPEILPEDAHAVRDDVVMATGRSDYPNQVNNVLCFPYIFRGALDVGATTITRGMEKAAVIAICQVGAGRAKRSGGRRLRHLWRLLRSRILYSQAFRSAPDRAHCGGCRASPPWKTAWPPAPSPTWKTMPTSCSNSCIARARS